VAFEPSTNMLVAEYVDINFIQTEVSCPKAARRGTRSMNKCKHYPICEKEGFCKTIQSLRAKFGMGMGQ
jgi:hypothetical protein